MMLFRCNLMSLIRENLLFHTVSCDLLHYGLMIDGLLSLKVDKLSTHVYDGLCF